MNEQARARYERLLDPDVLRGSLIGAAVVVTVFEVFRASITDRLLDFYAMEWDKNGPKESAEYQLRVGTRHKNRLEAALDWHLESGVLDQDDLTVIRGVRATRNKLAHEMATWATQEGLTDEIAEQLGELIIVLDKVESWWIVNVEMAVDDEFSELDVDVDQVFPGQLLWIQILLNVALGDESESRRYIDEFRARIRADHRNTAGD